MRFDVVIIGGGPAGLQAALTLGRARRRVLLCDAGERRNALAVHVHNFVTRDGTPPGEFRSISRAQLAAYPSVEIADARVESVTGSRGSFRIQLPSGVVEARRVLLAVGMVDEPLAIDGFRELWGRAIFQCPYCHGWEVRDRHWGFLAQPHAAAHVVPFARMIRSLAADVTVFTNAAVELDAAARASLEAAGIRVETAPIARLVRSGPRLDAVELAGGARVPCDVLFTQPPQHQVELVTRLGLALDGDGFVAVDPMKRETSVPGIYAAGDLTTRGQAAVLAAAAGMQAAGALNADLAMD
jgi:thioredoxin reductase